MKESPSLAYSKNIQEYELNNKKYRPDSRIYAYKYTKPKSIQVIELFTLETQKKAIFPFENNFQKKAEKVDNTQMGGVHNH
ncbi:unnamed protein product, partial [Sphenostylis stenocarpa]